MGTLPTTPEAPTNPGDTPGLNDQLRVVVVDSRHERRQLMSHVVEQADDVVVVGFADGPVSAVAAVERSRADAVILEIQLPVAQGLDTISALRDDFPELVIIVCSFRADATTRREALDRGADSYLAKPLSLRDIRAALDLAPRRVMSHL